MTGEKFGGAQRTETSDEFKKLEAETEKRRDHTEKVHVALQGITTKRKDLLSSKDVKLPVEALGSALTAYGSALGSDSECGKALIRSGDAHENLGGIQAEFMASATNTYVQHLANYLLEMKDYQRLKTKLENRRLDFDAKLNKIHKVKSESTKLEEECRVAQDKYEETLADTTDKMVFLTTSEDESLLSLCEFVDAEVVMFQDSLKVLQKLQSELADVRANISAKPKPTTTTRISRADPDDNAYESPPMSRASSYKSGKNTPSRMSSTSTAARGGAKMLRVLYDFDAEGPGELTIRKGDIINLIVEIDDGWWEGSVVDTGESGMFPSNYVEVIEEAPAPAPAPTMPSRPVSMTRTGSTTANNFPPRPSTASSSTLSVGKGSASNGPSPTPSGPPPAYGACSSCGCSDFTENNFKPGQCRVCFHRH